MLSCTTMQGLGKIARSTGWLVNVPENIEIWLSWSSIAMTRLNWCYQDTPLAALRKSRFTNGCTVHQVAIRKRNVFFMNVLFIWSTVLILWFCVFPSEKKPWQIGFFVDPSLGTSMTLTGCIVHGCGVFLYLADEGMPTGASWTLEVVPWWDLENTSQCLKQV